ncbi:hypothetical protein HY643_01945 [Candidatus Woesearchaeota archaeon]|nr:hypothetical protein [Candidatus Woesearchaeota archaeon]
MIEPETIKHYTFIDFLIILLIVVMWKILQLVANYLFSEAGLIANFILLGIMLSFTSLLVRKSGAVIILSAISAPLINLGGIGIFGWKNFFVMLIAAIIFELSAFLARLELKRASLGIVIGSGLANTSIVFFATIFTSIQIMSSMAANLINLMIVAFLCGIIGSLISFLGWHLVERTKPILRYEYRS